MEEDKGTKPDLRFDLPVLPGSVFLIATCAIFYELLISTVSSYFLGSSVLQFSLTIGLFMFFMGVGSYISKFFDKNLLDLFVNVEIVLGLLGGVSTALLYAAHTMTELYCLVAFLLIAVLGTLVGLEIPLVTRIIKEYSTLKDTIAQVLVLAGAALPDPAQLINRLQNKLPQLQSQLRFLQAETSPKPFVFDTDIQADMVLTVNKLDNQVLIRYYEKALKECN